MIAFNFQFFNPLLFKMTEVKSIPWMDGIYKISNRNVTLYGWVYMVTGENVKKESVTGVVMDEERTKGTWKFGEFEEAHPEVSKMTGKKHNNVHVTFGNGAWNQGGVVSENGKQITLWSPQDELISFEWMSEDEYTAFKDFGDPADAPPNHYKIQPEYRGQLIWVSGTPGMGKSTSGLILSKIAGYVYYEGDAFAINANPYIPPDAVEPYLAISKQKPLKRLCPDRITSVNAGLKDIMALIEGKDYVPENLNGFYTEMCKDIAFERKRIGGDWVVAQAVPTRAYRDHIRKQLGPDLIFVVLHMTKEDQKKRIIARHGKEGGKRIEWLSKLYDLYEPASDDEENAINLVVTNDMSREDVAQKILKKISE